MKPLVLGWRKHHNQYSSESHDTSWAVQRCTLKSSDPSGTKGLRISGELLIFSPCWTTSVYSTLDDGETEFCWLTLIYEQMSTERIAMHRILWRLVDTCGHSWTLVDAVLFWTMWDIPCWWCDTKSLIAPLDSFNVKARHILILGGHPTDPLNVSLKQGRLSWVCQSSDSQTFCLIGVGQSECWLPSQVPDLHWFWE